MMTNKEVIEHLKSIGIKCVNENCMIYIDKNSTNISFVEEETSKLNIYIGEVGWIKLVDLTNLGKKPIDQNTFDKNSKEFENYVKLDKWVYEILGYLPSDETCANPRERFLKSLPNIFKRKEKYCA